MMSHSDYEIDSEDENCPAWLMESTEAAINDFTDVNEGEKQMLNLWSSHVMKHNYIANKQLLSACETFVDLHGSNIINRKLYRNCLLHFSN